MTFSAESPQSTRNRQSDFPNVHSAVCDLDAEFFVARWHCMSQVFPARLSAACGMKLPGLRTLRPNSFLDASPTSKFSVRWHPDSNENEWALIDLSCCRV